MSTPPSLIVFLTERNPDHLRGGGMIRDCMILRHLRARAPVKTIFYGDNGLSPFYPPWYRKALSYFRSHVVNGYDPRVVQELRRAYIDGSVLWVSRLVMAKYIKPAITMGYRVILDEHNVESELLNQLQEQNTFSLRARWLVIHSRWLESRFCRLAGVVTATSELDAIRLKKLAPQAKMIVVPNSVDTKIYHDASLNIRKNRSILLFPATLDYYPNLEGVHWFVEKILPRLKEDAVTRQIKIVIAGANASEALASELANAGVTLVKSPMSMLPLLSEAIAVFVPLLSGSGTRIKILEAMASGCPVVSTPRGSEGLGIPTGNGVFNSESPASFASTLIDLAKNDALWELSSSNAVRYVKNKFDWEAHGAQIDLALVQRRDAQCAY